MTQAAAPGSRFDHAVILVKDLARATSEYAGMGFTVTAGGVHEGGGTRNALIAFADGSYLELLTYSSRMLARSLPVLRATGLGHVVSRGRTGIDARFMVRGLRGYGLIDYALNPSVLESTLTRLRREGIRSEGPHRGGRAVDEGERIEWEVALPGPRELPFLCADVTARARRVPEGAATEHANGVSGIAAMVVVVESVETSSARFRALLGSEPEPGSRERLGDSRGRIFTLGGTQLVVVSPPGGTHPMRRHLRARGEGPYMVQLRGTATGAGSSSSDRLRVDGLQIDAGAIEALR